jgi:hypothetical protein
LKDDGRPIGIDFQEWVPNHPKRLWSRATVVSVGGKVQEILVLVCVRETSESKPSDDASLGSDVVKTRGDWILWEKPAGVLITRQAATGVKGA